MCTWTCLLCYQELGSLSSTGSGSLPVLKYIGTAIEGECLICLNFFFFFQSPWKFYFGFMHTFKELSVFRKASYIMHETRVRN